MNIRILEGIVISALLVVPALADEARVETYKTQLRDVRPAEMPRETSRLITSGKADAADAVTAALSLNSASAPLIVGSVAKSSPKSAGAASGAAIAALPKLSSDAALQPRLAVSITKAAVSAAPSEISAIVAQSCKARPASFYIIGVAAAEAAPKSSDEVIPAIISGVPALKPVIQRSQADFKAANRSASLALVLKHAENMLAAVSRSQNVSPEALLAKETDVTLAEKLTSLAAGPTPPIQFGPFVSGGAPGELSIPGTTNLPASNRVYSLP